jgi:hypothetical protein
MLCQVPPFYCYAECYYAECYYAECYYAECYYAERYYAECDSTVGTFRLFQDHLKRTLRFLLRSTKPNANKSSLLLKNSLKMKKFFFLQLIIYSFFDVIYDMIQ